MRSDLVLHYAPDNASLVVRLALSEMALPFETSLVDRASAAQKSQAYRRLNPNGLIPVLETVDGPLFETAAILLWLLDRHEKLGPTSNDPWRGRFLSWLFFVSNTLHPALRMLFYSPSYIGDDTAHQRKLRDVATDEAIRFFGMLDSVAAQDTPILASNDPTVLDFYAAACLRWAQLYPKESPHRGRFGSENWTNLHAMARQLENRQSVRDWCLAEGIGHAPFTRPDYPNPPEGSAL